MEEIRRPDNMVRITTPELAKAFIDEQIKALKEQVGDKKVLLALSGGVDSSVTALLLFKAIGKDLICVFVDHGMLRKDEGDVVEKTFRETFGLNLMRVNAGDRFLEKLKGVRDPETKRKILGEEFIRVFEDEAKKIGHVHALAQGTIYPDVIESGKGASAVIKSHHNVGGLPDVISFDEIVEPLNNLFKDEVRHVGTMLGIPKDLYTPLFAVARCVSWCAHRMEELVNGGPILRPAYKPIFHPRDYVKLTDR